MGFRLFGAIRRIRMVMKDGAVYFPEEIHRAMGIAPFAKKPAIVVVN